MPPLIVRGHDVSQLEIRDRGVLLGVRGKGMPGLPTYREEMRYLAPGSTLIFYTDGLVDRRQRADGSGHYTDAEVQQMLATCGAVGGRRDRRAGRRGRRARRAGRDRRRHGRGGGPDL